MFLCGYFVTSYKDVFIQSLRNYILFLYTIKTGGGKLNSVKIMKHGGSIIEQKRSCNSLSLFLILPDLICFIMGVEDHCPLGQGSEHRLLFSSDIFTDRLADSSKWHKSPCRKNPKLLSLKSYTLVVCKLY